MSKYKGSFKIVLFGDKGSGKAALTHRYLTNLYKADSTMTTGVDFNVKSVEIYNESGETQRVKLQIWDFGGEERFKFLLPHYVRGTAGGLFVYDITNFSTLAHIDDWLMVIRKDIKPENQFPILLVGTKAHLENMREVSVQEAKEIAKSRGLSGFIECSAKTGQNVEKVFQALVRLMIPS